MNWLNKFDLKTILILVLIVVLLLRSCGGNEVGKEIIKVDGKDYELLEQKIDTIFIEKTIKVPTYIPKYITKIVTETVQVPIYIDTLKIVQDYFARYEVKDTLNLTYDFPKSATDSLGNKPAPSLGYGVLTDIISQNQIQSRDIKWFFQIPTIYNTTIVKELPKKELYWGVFSGFNKTDVINNVGVGLLYKNKKMNVYQIALGVNNNSNTAQLTPFISAGMYWKIGKK